MTRAVHLNAGSIVEVPITFREREQGVSKMSKNIVLEALILVSIWGITRVVPSYFKKVKY